MRTFKARAEFDPLFLFDIHSGGWTRAAAQIFSFNFGSDEMDDRRQLGPGSAALIYPTLFCTHLQDATFVRKSTPLNMVSVIELLMVHISVNISRQRACEKRV